MTFQHLCSSQTFQNMDALAVAEPGNRLDALQLTLQPALFCNAGYMHIFHADASAVGFLQLLQNPCERQVCRCRQGTGIKTGVQIRFCKLVVSKREFAKFRFRFLVQWIRSRLQVAEKSIGVYELQDTRLLLPGFGIKPVIPDWRAR